MLERTDKLLSLTLIVNTLVHALATALVTAIAINTFGNHQRVITIAAAAVAFVLIVFAEITPKFIGAIYLEHITLPTSFVFKPLMDITKPVIWFVNLVVAEILKILRIKTGKHTQEQRVSPEGNYARSYWKAAIHVVKEQEHLAEPVRPGKNFGRKRDDVKGADRSTESVGLGGGN